MEGKLGAIRILRPAAEIDVGQILLVVAMAVLAAGFVTQLLPRIAERTPGRIRLRIVAWVPPLKLLILFLAVALIIPLVIEPTLGNLVAVLSGAAVAIGFALKDYVSSLVAGVVASFERPYRQGDWVKVGDAYGEVRAIGLRAVKLVTADDTAVTVPHGLLWTSLVHQANDGTGDLMCVANFYLQPAHDGTQARRALYDVALTSAFVNLSKPIAVIVTEEPWGTHYRLKAYPVNLRDQFEFLSDLTVRGKAALTALGIAYATMPVAVSKDGPRVG